MLLVLISLTQKCKYAFRKAEMETITVDSVVSPVSSIVVPLKSIFQRNIPSGDAFAEICFLRGDYLMYLNDSFHSSQNQESGFAHHAKGQSHQCRRKHRCFTQTTAIICTKKQYQDVLRVSDESRQLFYSSFTNIPHGFSSFEKEENSCGI